jgi:hypothetical protein
MLDAGDEYLLKQLGIIGSSARPSDPTMPDSWEQAGGYGAGGPNPYGTPGAEPAYSHTKKMRINVDGTMKDINADDKSQWPSILKKADASSGDTEIAGGIPYGTPGADKPYVRKGYKDKKGKFVDYDNPSTWPSIIKKASNKQKSMVAHHEPEGDVLSENKKSFKDITNKIPGYYDGKPAPLGFPIEEPPKTVNGKHPDLVDGKKVSDRYNRLDPISAKAMPKTGNPHIDKKVAKAQKKAK